MGVREGMERGGWVGENVSHNPCEISRINFCSFACPFLKLEQQM